VLDEWDVGNDWTVSGSLRFDSFRYEADGNVFYTNPGSTAAENVAQTEPGTYDETALTGGLGLSKLLDPDWMVYGSWARGYRLFPPGFGLRQSGFGIQAPTDGLLDPTTADQFELGTRVRRSWWSLGVAGYYSFLKNVQQPVPGSYQGQESIDLDGSGTVDLDEGIFVTTGADGYVTGIEIDSEIVLDHFFSNMQGWTWHNGFMANYGLVDEPTGEEPLRHTHPARFLTALRWEDGDPLRGRWFEFIGDFAARYDQVSDGRLNGDPGYLNDPQDSNSGLITDYGLPSYEVFHLRGGITLAKGIDLTVAVENLFDTKYRTAHSRMDAAGRNVMVGVTATF
jgi:outer membrane receptor protein involved in Fe transport